MVYALGLLGLLLLVVGGDVLVRGATSIARRLGVSDLMIGLTLVGFGTSTPELVTSIEAALIGSPGIAIGNVVGSNIANILLILGIAACIQPIAADPEAFRRDGVVLVATALAALAVVLYGQLDRWVGVVFVAAIVGYVVFAYRHERATQGHRGRSAETPPPAGTPEEKPLLGPAGCVLMAVVGIAATVLGAHMLVDAAVAMAAAFRVPETVIGLTVVAVGTSLPELATSVVAAVRRYGDVALGNVIGSNIFNVLFILGMTALVQPIPVPAAIVAFDIWVMLGATAALICLAVTGWRIVRLEGTFLLAGYGAYLAYLGMATF